MDLIDWRALDKYVEVDRKVDPQKFTLYSIFRNEAFFCAAFLNHYRSIGVEQFIIFDDGSVDGTREFLEGQPDCVVLRSTLTFGQKVNCRPADGVTKKKSFEIFLKSAIPKFFLNGGFALYADADEFLFLPPGVSNVRLLVENVKKNNGRAIVSSLVDFFPVSFSEISVPIRAKTLNDLLYAYGFFEARQVVEIDSKGIPIPVCASKLDELIFESGKSLERHWYRRLMERVSGRARPNPMSYKTPIVRQGSEVYYVHSHKVNSGAVPDKILTMAHFVFTCNSYNKARQAVDAGVYSGRVSKYTYFLNLIDQGSQGERSLLGENSTRFRDVGQFIECGLMRW